MAEDRRPLRGVAEITRRVASELRHRETPAEQRLWSALRDRRAMGVKFRRQHAIERFVLDFYCPAARLAVELDGGVHDEPQQQERDLARTAALQAHGIRVLRIPNELVLEHPGTAVLLIRQNLKAPLPLVGEGGEP